MDICAFKRSFKDYNFVFSDEVALPPVDPNNPNFIDPLPNPYPNANPYFPPNYDSYFPNQFPSYSTRDQLPPSGGSFGQGNNGGGSSSGNPAATSTNTGMNPNESVSFHFFMIVFANLIFIFTYICPYILCLSVEHKINSYIANFLSAQEVQDQRLQPRRPLLEELLQLQLPQHIMEIIRMTTSTLTVMASNQLLLIFFI